MIYECASRQQTHLLIKYAVHKKKIKAERSPSSPQPVPKSERSPVIGGKLPPMGMSEFENVNFCKHKKKQDITKKKKYLKSTSLFRT